MQISPSLAQVRIILVEPAGPRNVGAIARVLKNMGLQQLVLVNPQCDPTGPEARQMAVHAQDLLDGIQQVVTLPEALQGCYRAIATTARTRDLAQAPESPRSALPWLLETPSALIFGREDSGLTNQELNYAQRYVAIATDPGYASLNLAQAVGICCYELRCAALTAELQSTEREVLLPQLAEADSIQSESQAAPASLDQLESYFQHLETLLLDIGYLYPHTSQSRMFKFRQLYKRAMLSQQELALLRGVLSRMEWIRHNPEKPSK